MQSKRLFPLFGFLALALAFPAHAVVVVGGDNGWEVSFDGNVNGFYVYEDADIFPGVSSSRSVVSVNDDGNLEGTASDGSPLVAGDLMAIPVPTSRAGGTISNDTESTRIRTGLLPAFFSFNVRSPEVGGLRGSARISFAPQIQNANTKNQFNRGTDPDTQAGAQIDMREVFFNVDGDFGTVSVGRTLSLFQRHNILTDMTLFGVGAQGSQGGGGTTLGRIGHGYVYSQFNARISYKTPSVSGFQFEVGVYDPSRISTNDPNPVGGITAWTETSVPRLEAEATYATDYTGGSVKAWFGGLWQEAELPGAAPAGVNDKVTATGIHGGLQLGFQGLEVMFSGYTGEGLGTTLMLDADSVDACGNERDNFGFIGQFSYTFNGRTKFGVSYGESTTDETDVDLARRIGGAPSAPSSCVVFVQSQLPSMLPNVGASLVGSNLEGTSADPSIMINRNITIDSQSAFTAGIYHDVNAWLKVIAEYSKTENDWHDGASQEADTISVGSFFLW